MWHCEDEIKWDSGWYKDVHEPHCRVSSRAQRVVGKVTMPLIFPSLGALLRVKGAAANYTRAAGVSEQSWEN